MDKPSSARNLAKQAPRSPRDRLAGFAIAQRTVDKCRATLAKTAGEYHYDCPLDRMLFDFKGITGDQFKTAVRASKSDAAVGLWLQAAGTPKTKAEIKAWSEEMEADRSGHDPQKRAAFVASCEKLHLDPESITTFSWLEADDLASFKPKAKTRLIFNP